MGKKKPKDRDEGSASAPAPARANRRPPSRYRMGGKVPGGFRIGERVYLTAFEQSSDKEETPDRFMVTGWGEVSATLAASHAAVSRLRAAADTKPPRRRRSLSRRSPPPSPHRCQRRRPQVIGVASAGEFLGKEGVRVRLEGGSEVNCGVASLNREVNTHSHDTKRTHRHTLHRPPTHAHS